MINKSIAITCLAAIIGAAVFTTAHADVIPAALFQDHAVLQAGKPLPVWGQADAGENVTVSFAGQTVSTMAGTNGQWQVTLAPLKINAEPAELTIAGKNKFVLKDVLVGEVWLCSGQSNMEFLLNRATNAMAEIAAANFPLVRQFLTQKKLSNTPETTAKGKWAVCSPATAGQFTAVGYFFARELHQKLGVPVGLLHSSWGGTDIEAWMSAESIAGNPDLKFVPEHWQKQLDKYPALKAAWDAKEAAIAKATAESKTNGVAYKRPWNPEPPNSDGSPHHNKPSNLFNGMIAPLVPTALAGVLWYQGENNAGRADEYRQLFPALITGWRAAFGQPNLPFYWVQLPNFNGQEKIHDWVDMRVAQSAALAVPDTAQAITIDVGEAADIHPKNKQDVGHRLAVLALQKVYGQKIISNGPVFSGVSFPNGVAQVAFTEIASGLAIKGDSLTGFELAGEDRVFHPAEARIDGAMVMVSSADVSAPVAVRYAWHNAPVAALMNSEGLPAAAFRSDAWSDLAQAATSAHWENQFVQFNFDAAKGTFSIADKRDGRVVIEDAVFQINQSASDQGYAYHWNAEAITDELGSGRKITIEGKSTNQPSLVLEVFLYDSHGCVVLNEGIENTANQEMRVKNFSPLKATAFKGFDFVDYKTLDGESGFPLTQVSTGDVLKSKNNLLVTFGGKGGRKHSLVIGGLSYQEFQKNAAVTKRGDHLEVELTATDPVGKLVDANAKYIFKDKFYLDFTTDNRFEALEKYGAALSAANHCDVSGVTIPILNFWYAFVGKFGGDEFRDNSLGTLEELEHVEKTGFLKYSPVGLRLEPDDYALPNNQQGWWDDKHWQMYKGGQLLPPYDTIVKWGGRVRELGGVPFIYCQTAKRSEDYCVQHPDQMLFNSPTNVRSKGPIGWWGKQGDKTAIYWTYDFTDPGFIAHMEEVYRNLKAGGVQGIKFDYPDTGWAYDGGFEDKYATTTSAYRNIFKLAYDGLGPNRDVQERIPPFGDVALGVVTTQRTEGDNDRVYPGRVSKVGLRWYKNRMVANYDCDPINPYHIYPKDTRDGWRAAITMTYTTSGRMEIGKYFEKMTADMLFDLSRAVPLLAAPAASARPVDAFTGKPYPQVYDFTVQPDWHIVTLFNQKIEGEEWPTDVMAYWTEGKQFNPQKMIPATIAVPLGDATDDGGLALDAAKKYYVFDFWNWNFVGKFSGDAKLSQEMRPGEARVLAVHEAKEFPQFLSTSRHLLQGYLDMTKFPEWNPGKKELAGTSKVIADEPYKIIIAANGFKIKKSSAAGAKCKLALVDKKNSIYELTITSKQSAEVTWAVTFKK